MIELFTIFGKGGLVLWCFQEGQRAFKDSVDELVSTVLIHQKSLSSFNRQGMTMKYRLDNEFDLILVVAYQSIMQLGYSDKLLTEVNLRFRDMYKNALDDKRLMFFGGPTQFRTFDREFLRILSAVQSQASQGEAPKPRGFQDSHKSKKTLASMQQKVVGKPPEQKVVEKQPEQKVVEKQPEQKVVEKQPKMLRKQPKQKAVDKQPKPKAGKQARVWELTGSGKDAVTLDYSAAEQTNGQKSEDPAAGTGDNEEVGLIYKQNIRFVGKMCGELQGLDEEEEEEEEGDGEEKEEGGVDVKKSSSGGGWLSAFKALVGNKQLSKADLEPVLEKMEEIMINKNVASEPANKICESVGAKLEGKVVGTFNRVNSVVREAMREALVQLLTPKRRVDILRDITEAKREQRPYVVVFCGVNGVGKSTNLAKITFWLNENGLRVMIAAGDTFRAGAVEQLRTHTRHLNALHDQGVQLYEQGYGKDPANLAAAAIQLARERKVDVVLVDTAGRMQDNEPLMRALSKLIRVNEPDLVLFVGEALVGNEAVDQLVKFNQALADNSAVDKTARLIDGIVLTKFDTIDDKVGAAISMTYITGQPIVFVGTGQTYSDLRSLNVNAVVNSLLK